MLETIATHILPTVTGLFLATFMVTGIDFFWTGARAHRAAEAVDRAHAEAHRLTNDLIARELRDNT